MPYRIGGYYMSFPIVYKVMEALEIPNPLDYDDTLLEFATNFWLCDQNKLNVLAAYIHKDDQPGMMLVSSSKVRTGAMYTIGLQMAGSSKSRTAYPIPGTWKKATETELLVMNGAGVKADELKRITLLDNRKITANGIQPKRMTIGKSTKTPAEVIEEMKEAVRAKRELETCTSNSYWRIPRIT